MNQGRTSLDDGWSIELLGSWTRGRTTLGGTTWHAPGRTVRVATGGEWRCADGASIIASLDAELPPNPTGKVGEGGSGGIGHRAAWLYRHDGEVKYVLYGYNFVDATYLQTVFTSADTTHLRWAFDAWRSVARSLD
ncbi:hypothetical protein [Micromonospora vulcania]|uniref:Uncharacterized protein n=1 Tax=Micromonospora vulcania TaxID=1441873 RepID=A0ABW1HAQ9_9ACTN